MVPEHFFANVRQRIRREWVVCFFAALLIGLTAHFYKLVNWLPNWEALVFRYYISKIYEEIKARPRYIVAETLDGTSHTPLL